MGTEQRTVAVIGAGGKMGMRVSANLARSEHNVLFSETSPAGQERVRAEGRQITDTEDAVGQSDVVILAVPDVILGDISQSVVPQMNTGAILLTPTRLPHTPASWQSATTFSLPVRTPVTLRCSLSEPARRNGRTHSVV